MTTILRVEAIQQAMAILGVLRQLDPTAPERLRIDAINGLGDWPDLRIEFVREIAVGRCSIGGEYRRATATEPATLVVSESASLRRRQFSTLHEFGHHLQRTTMSLLQRLDAAVDPDMLEEAACEVFAAVVLLPDDLVRGIIGHRGPTAADVADLYVRSGASRAACCVRAAEHLHSPGAVFLLDAAGVVNFSVGREMPPPAWNSDQASTALIAAAMRGAGRAQISTQVLYRTGSRSEQLYGDCAPIDGWMVAIVVRDRPAWKSFAPPRPGTGQWTGATWWTCEYCDESFQVFTTTRCDTCEKPRCSKGHCTCTQARERRCSACGMNKHRSQFSMLTTDICIDCT